MTAWNPLRQTRRRALGLIAIVAIGAAAGWGIRDWRAGNDLRQARAAVTRDQQSEAVAAYHRHLKCFPDDHPVRLELAATLKHRDPEAALRELRAIPLNVPESLTAARQVAAISLELGRDYDAPGPLLLLQERLPDDAGIQLALAEIRFRERNYEAALKHARRRRELLPAQVDSYLLIAESLDELKRPADMVEPLEVALKLDPDLAQGHLNLAYALQLTGRNEEALRHVEWFLQRHPETASAHRILAMIERSMGRPDEALAAVQTALRLQPRNLDAALLEVELLLFLRRADEAFHKVSDLASQVGDERRVLTLQVQAATLARRTTEARRLQSRLKHLTDVE